MEEMYHVSFKHIEQDVLSAAHAGATSTSNIQWHHSSPVAVRAKYFSLALARVGFGPIQKSMIPLGSTLTAEDIEELKLRAREARLDYAAAAALLEKRGE